MMGTYKYVRYNKYNVYQLFDALVGILSYSSKIWGFSKSKEVKRVHLKFYKRMDSSATVNHDHL